MADTSHTHNPEQKYEVTPLELFFDLVFAFAISQLSQHLFTHLSWRGGAETLVLLIAIFASWFTTSWSATLIKVDKPRSIVPPLTVL
jgi:low temperature requirement protein LtrA